MRIKNILFPGLIVLFSLIYSLSLVPTQTVFGFDQARDAYEAYSIWNGHHPKILGPSTDIPGLNHGVLWYYVLAFAYFIGNGVPENAVYVLLVGLYLLVPVIGYFTYKMSKNFLITGTTLVLYVMSPLYLSFTHWLSNPLLALYIVPPLFYLLWRYIHKQTSLLAVVIGFLYSLMIQSDFGYVVLLLVLPIYYYVFALRFSLRHSLLFLAGLLFGLTSFFVTYIKFHTNIVGIISEFLFKNSGDNVPVGQIIFSLLDNVIRLINFTYLPLPQLLVFALLLFLMIRFRKKLFKADKLLSFTFIWLYGIVFLFVMNHGDSVHNFLYGPFLYPLALIFAIGLVRLLPNVRWLILVVAVLVGIQFMETHRWVSNTNSPLSVQQGMTINYQREVLQYIYTSADKKPFVIATITNPLEINTTWSYLFNFYGKSQYGYLPSYWGKNQTGYLGDLPEQKDLNSPTLRYLIIEPNAGIQEHWIAYFIYKENLLSDIVEEKKIGEFTIQKRLFHPDKPPIPEPGHEKEFYEEQLRKSSQQL